jgi:hypothetical protein
VNANTPTVAALAHPRLRNFVLVASDSCSFPRQFENKYYFERKTNLLPNMSKILCKTKNHTKTKSSYNPTLDRLN